MYFTLMLSSFAFFIFWVLHFYHGVREIRAGLIAWAVFARILTAYIATTTPSERAEIEVQLSTPKCLTKLCEAIHREE